MVLIMSISKNVELMIKGSQGYSGDDMKNFEMFIVGTLKKLKDRWIISYANENNGLTQIVVLGKKTVIVKANGDINYYLRLSESKNTKATFKSNGLFSYMSTYTSRIDTEMTKSNKYIELCYDLKIDSENVMKNELYISVGLLNN